MIRKAHKGELLKLGYDMISTLLCKGNAFPYVHNPLNSREAYVLKKRNKLKSVAFNPLN